MQVPDVTKQVISIYKQLSFFSISFLKNHPTQKRTVSVTKIPVQEQGMKPHFDHLKRILNGLTCNNLLIKETET